MSEAKPTFLALLRDQIRSEFTSAQQYVAAAVWFDAHDLPRLASHFYRQALEERNHGMMFVQYFLDNDLPVQIPPVGPVRNDFVTVAEVIEMALAQEKAVSDEIVTLAKTARNEGDYIGEQFLQWFLKEQVEEVAQMTTLLNVVHRGKDNLFEVENFLARESVGDGGRDSGAPRAAGGSV